MCTAGPLPTRACILTCTHTRAHTHTYTHTQHTPERVESRVHTNTQRHPCIHNHTHKSTHSHLGTLTHSHTHTFTIHTHRPFYPLPRTRLLTRTRLLWWLCTVLRTMCLARQPEFAVPPAGGDACVQVRHACVYMCVCL
jgi:hypothetical protein